MDIILMLACVCALFLFVPGAWSAFFSLLGVVYALLRVLGQLERIL
jgi:hypothetical protein